MGIEYNNYTNYTINGWYIRLPKEWKMTVEGEQVIFDIDEDAVNVYISTFYFGKPETGEKPSAELVSSCILKSFSSPKYEVCKSFSKYYPEGFITHIGKCITSDGYTMIACKICTEGCYFSFDIVGDADVNFEKYIQHINSIRPDI